MFQQTTLGLSDVAIAKMNDVDEWDRLLWLREVHRAFCRRGMVFVRLL